MSEQNNSTATAVATTGGKSASTTASNYSLPSDVTLKHASKLSIVEDKPIMLDYWSASLDKKALVGVKDNGEKLLVKSLSIKASISSSILSLSLLPLPSKILMPLS